MQVCEEAIYNTQGVTVQPIVNEGDSLLTIVYPTEMRGQIENRIDSEKVEFKRILDAHHSKVMALTNEIDKFKGSSKVYGDAAHYAGRFLGGLFGVPQA